MRVKSSGLARGLANARPPGSATFAKAPTPGTDKAGKCPAVAGAGGLAQVELTDALSSGGVFFIIIFNESAIRRYIDRGSHHESRTRWSG